MNGELAVRLCFGFAGSIGVIDAVSGRKMFQSRRSENPLPEVRWPARAFQATVGLGFLLGAILS